MSKTAISLLQEMLIKRSSCPEYTFLKSDIDNGFVYNVTALGKVAEGRGKSKKEAMHAAAQQLINLISNEGELDTSSIVGFTNYVGKLQELCTIKGFLPPKYDTISEHGPAHQKVFVVSCKVSTYTTEGSSNSKQLAKHNAARAMLVEIGGVDATSDIKSRRVATDDELRENQIFVKKKLSSYFSNGTLHNLNKHNIAKKSIHKSKLDVYSNTFNEGSFKKSELFNQLRGKTMHYFQSLQDPVSLFVEVTDEVQLKWEAGLLRVKPGIGEIAICISFSILHNTTFIGHGKDQESAFQRACIESLHWFSVMGS